nr:hypothetical protein [Arthrobacter sp. AQ5-05]
MAVEQVVSHGDVFLVPVIPVSGLVACDGYDRLSLGVEGEKNA